MKRQILAIGSLAISGCISVPVVDHAANEQPLSTASMRCSTPYAFTQDCADRWLARRLIRMEDVDAAIAATADERTILVMDGHAFRNMMLKLPLVLNAPRHSKASNAAYEAVSKVLRDKGVEIRRTIPVMTLSDVSGYVLELTAPGYGLLKAYTVE